MTIISWDDPPYPDPFPPPTQKDEKADAPSPRGNPVVDLDAELEPLERVDQVIEDIAWNQITVQTPELPTFAFENPPTTVDPLLPDKPVLDPLEIPDQIFVEVADKPHILPDNEIITIPADVDLPQWTSDVPSFGAQLPSGGIDWSYEDFSSSYRQMLADRFSGFVLPDNPKAFGEKLNQGIFVDPTDALTQRGATNKIRSRLLRDIDLAKQSFNNVAEFSKARMGRDFDKIEISSRTADEQMLHDQNRRRNELEFQFADKVAETAIKSYNAVIEAYNAEVAAYKVLATEYQAEIARREMLIQQATKKLELSGLIVQYNSQLAEKLNAEISCQEALITLFKTQMDAAKRLARLQLLETELFRIEIQAFISATEAEIAKARQKTIEAEVEADKVEAELAEPLQERLQAEIDKANVELLAAQKKYDAARLVYEALEKATNVDIESFDVDTAVREDLANARLVGLFKGAKLDEKQAELEGELREHDYNMERLDHVASQYKNLVRWFWEEVKIIRRTRVDSAISRSKDLTDKASIESAELLAAAKIINTLNHVIAEATA